MSTTKVYTYDSHPNNVLMLAAKKKKLTGVTVTWHKAMSSTGRGWVMTCDQIPWIRLGFDQQTALKKLQDLEIKENAG